jgi:CRISPR-associated endonuclease Csn1
MNSSTEKRLGLDIGANSIGWALIEVQKTNGNIDNKPSECICKTGVRIFPAGKENFESNKEKSLTEDRRKSRGMRRRTRRLAARKNRLKVLLKSSGLWFDDLEKTKNDPLELRARGISEQLTLPQLGQALYHLCQRRGFRSARKTPVTAKPKKMTKTDENEANANDQGEKKEDILAKIGQLADEIKKSGKQTLGAYLYSIRAQDKHQRIRNRHTRRDMFIEEFNILWDKQTEFYPDVLTPELKKKIGDQDEGIIFFQRNIYWRQSTIGECEFEVGEQRCPRADRLAQEFRFYQEINNLKYVDPTSNEEIRVADDPNMLLEIVKLAKKREKISFDAIRKCVGLQETSTRFNLETGSKKRNKKSNTEEEVFRKDLKGFETDAVFRKSKFFGNHWDTISEEERNKMVRILIEKPMNPESEKMEFDHKGRAKQMTEEQLRDYVSTHWKQWGLSDTQIDQLLDIENELPQGYLSLSRKAIAKILPYMRKGLLFSGTEDKDGNYNDAIHQAGYVRRDEENDWEHFEFLPSPERIRGLGTINNPVVRRIVNETRRLINAIIREYGRPDKIHIELARNAKASSEERKRIMAQNNQNRDERENAKTRINEFNAEGHSVSPNRDNILKQRLWEQQDKICPYSGQTISMEKLFSEETDIDHILPYSRTLDDSMMNKVICFRSANADKRNETPYEWYKRKYPKTFDEELDRLKARIAKLPFPKKNRFTQKEIDVSGFTQRQLNDTKYASRYMLQYLRSIFTPEEWKEERRILTVKGGQTSDLRHFWGLDNILHNSDFLPDNLKPGEKNRCDHRHHAVDALVIALTDTHQLKHLAYYKYSSPKKSFPMPWQTFRHDAEDSINSIIVSHRPSGRVRGGLHEDTYYGPVRDTFGNIKTDKYTVRKKITDITPNEFFKIRDKRIKGLIFDRLKEKGVVPISKSKASGSEELQFPDGIDSNNKKTKYLKQVFSQPLYLCPRIPNNKHLSEIKKVRIVIRNETPRQLKAEGGYVIPGSTHHICMFENNHQGRAVRYCIFVTRLEANRRIQEQQRRIHVKRKELTLQGISGEEQKKLLQDYRRHVVTKEIPVIERFDRDNPQAKFLFTLKRGEVFRVWNNNNNQERLVIFKTAASTQGQLYFADLRDVRKDARFAKTPGSYCDIYEKHQVDRLGNYFPAND